MYCHRASAAHCHWQGGTSPSLGRFWNFLFTADFLNVSGHETLSVSLEGLQRTPFLGHGAPVFLPSARPGFGRARGRRAARRCLRFVCGMETALLHATFARHVPKPTRRGCGSAKLYPPEKALHERRDSNCSHGESARSTSGRG